MMKCAILEGENIILIVNHLFHLFQSLIDDIKATTMICNFISMYIICKPYFATRVLLLSKTADLDLIILMMTHDNEPSITFNYLV